MKSAPRFPIRNARVVLRVPEILRLCTNKKILHLGCADMPYTIQKGEKLLHKRLATITHPSMLWGLDVSKEGVRILREMGFDHIIYGDAEQISSELCQMNFDFILAAELIEHLANPGLFLKSLTSIMSRETELIVTTYNANSFKGFLHSMMRSEKVHPDHNYYFSYRTIKQLLEKFDFQCQDISYYQEISSSGPSRFFDKIAYLMTRISPVWADGVIVRARIRDTTTEFPGKGKSMFSASSETMN